METPGDNPPMGLVFNTKYSKVDVETTVGHVDFVDSAGEGVVRDVKSVTEFDDLDLNNDVHYADALINGIYSTDCEENKIGEGSPVLNYSVLENLGSDRIWMGKARRLGIAPIHFSQNQDGGRRTKFSCIHDDLYKTLP